MADISLRIKSDFEQAQRDFAQLAQSSESTRAQIEKFQKSFKTEQIDKFIAKNKMNATGILATKGAAAALAAEAGGLQREMQRLISKGMNPNDASLQKLKVRYADLNKQMGATASGASSFGNIIKGVLGANLIQRGIDTLIGGLKGIVTEAMKIEDAQAAFTPLLGGAEKAARMVEQLNIAAAETPFQFETLSGVARQLLPVMNGDIEKTIQTLNMLGDTAGGNAQKLDSITRGFTKAMLKGRVDMESLNMIAEAGVPIFTEMATSMGYGEKQMGAFFKKISTGTVSTDELVKAFQKMTTEGGIFFEGMIIASKTTSGIFSTLKDNVAMTAAGIGQAFLPQIKKAALGFIQASSGALKWVIANKEIIGQGVETVFGTIGTALSVVATVLPYVTAAFAAYMLVTKSAVAVTNLMAAAQAALNVVMSLNPVGLVVAAIAALVVAGIQLYKNWDVVSAKLSGIWESMKFASGVAWEGIKVGFLTAIKAIIVGISYIYKPFTLVIDQIITAFNKLTGKNIPTLSKAIGDFTGTLDAKIAQSNNTLKKLYADRARIVSAQIALEKKSMSDGDKARQQSLQTTISTNNASIASNAVKADSMKAQLEAVYKFDQNTNLKRIEEAAKFFEQRAALESEDGEARLEWLRNQYSTIWAMHSLSVEQRLEAEKGLNKAIVAEDRKLSLARVQFAGQMVSTASDMVADLQTVFANSGKQSHALALLFKGLAIAQAGIASYLAFTQVLADPKLFFPFKQIAAGITLAAGLVKVAAIASTPIPTAETGISNYTVPDIRSNQRDGAAVRASAGEKVTVTPRGEEAGLTQQINMQIGEDVIFRIVRKGIATGKIDISNRNIGRGVFAL